MQYECNSGSARASALLDSAAYDMLHGSTLNVKGALVPKICTPNDRQHSPYTGETCGTVVHGVLCYINQLMAVARFRPNVRVNPVMGTTSRGKSQLQTMAQAVAW